MMSLLYLLVLDLLYEHLPVFGPVHLSTDRDQLVFLGQIPSTFLMFVSPLWVPLREGLPSIILDHLIE